MPTSPSEKPWWRTAVIYQVYGRSFADSDSDSDSDSDGDGVGDLAGVRSRPAYIAGLGVDAIWLNPFYPSPQADAGYDVSDHRDVDPIFGTLAAFDGLGGRRPRSGPADRRAGSPIRRRFSSAPHSGNRLTSSSL